MAANEFTKRGLQRAERVLSGYVQRGVLPGLVAAFARGDTTRIEVHGRQDLDHGLSMRADSIFRISSMSKPITAVAALMLVDDCVLRLDDPVDELLPELADRRVLKRPGGPLDETVPAARSITLRDLLTFRAGFGGTWDPDWPLTAAAIERGIAPQPPRLSPEPAPQPDLYLSRLGELPLAYQPGEAWLYHTGIAVTGVLIARATGKPLEQFLRERVFEPLGMDDTGFHVPADKLDRFTTLYTGAGAANALTVADPAEDGKWTTAPAFPDGGGDLVSTVEDYLTFARLLLGRGRYSGTRLLSRPLAELMTSDLLTPANKARGGLLPGMWDAAGWGMGVRVVTRRTGYPAVGQYGWDGGLGSTWFNDPAENLIGILLTPRMWDSPAAPPVAQDFQACAYAALAD
ncbi:beta-lactamase family protein [Actinospica durhamensis]|uniref:Beta-lactamase family protein n=1 Tax=Actinospica durhamensis TaxID=1508375 RepID=A0A941EZ18_9ACTN|nr:serine hydrolase domain-containing protein [Actinospica durhamensis]MBR7839077.1 beta-lactamase family protein [Actinospica durhamensis]